MLANLFACVPRDSKLAQRALYGLTKPDKRFVNRGKNMNRFHFSFIAAAIVTMLVAPNIGAQSARDKPDVGASRTNDTRAAALRAEGEEFVKADDCKAAMDPLRSAWALREDGKTASLLGECELRLGHEPEAAQHFARAMELLPDGDARRRVESMFQDVSSRVTRVDVVVNEPGAVVVVGKFVMETPFDNLFVSPGEATVVVKKSGFGELQRTINAMAGKVTRADFILTRVREDSDLDRPKKHHDGLPMIPAYVGMGIGLASIAVGIGLRTTGNDSGKEADALMGTLVGKSPCKADPAPADCAKLLNLRSEHDRYVNASTGLFVTGGLLLGGSFVYAMVSSRKTPNDVAIIPVVSPTNNGLVIQGRF